MNTFYKVLTWVLVVAVIAIGIFTFTASSGYGAAQSGTGTTHYQAENFLQGLYIGTIGQTHFLNTGGIVQAFGSLVDVFSNLVVNNFVQAGAGYSATVTTSTVFTPAQYCTTTIQHIINTTALATETLPAASSSWLACGSPAFGAYSSEVIVNDSTNTLNIVAGAGTTFRCETQGVGTSTLGLGTACTASQVSLLASSSVQAFGYWTASSSNFIMWGNNFK